uniref:ZF(RING)-26 RING finger and SPRY domain-containing protein 1 n=1 Tax=Phallusia mammillata TaxID=59560 RepID=A0A6F9DQU7_9ASCI|nr:ZF(RING)-26 RING finger and SPRY domain-containing protein 1 [Phallusia mammillata]
MGNCYKKQKTSVRSIPDRRNPEDQDDMPYMLIMNNNTAASAAATANTSSQSTGWWRPVLRQRHSRNQTNDQPTWSFCKLTEDELDKHVLETLHILQSSAENDTTLILRMRMFRFWANGETGWNMVLSSLVRAIPLEDVLGPSAITLFIDHCPLPTKQAVLKFISNLQLSHSKAEEDIFQCKSQSKSARHRNICAVLGHLAESLAGPLSIAMLTDDALEYFIAGLDKTINNCQVPIVDILYSLISLEKFAQTGDNKTRIKQTKFVEKLMILENWRDSNDYKKRQVGFSAQWLLDNIFVVEGRKFTYEKVALDNINAMLNCNDVSEYLKISADGLEARSDAASFESVRCTFSVDSGVWYYEVTIITPGVMQIGWATKRSKFFNHDGYGIGDDEFSCAYDGCRQLYWYQAQSHRHRHPAWKEGDVLGLLLDVPNSEVIFYLNGDALPPERALFNCARSGFFAAASFMSHQQCVFNFGAEPFKFPPKNREFNSFNDHAQLTDEEKLVLPKHKKLQMIRQSSMKENSCDLCCDLEANIILQPCGHGGICHKCAEIIDSCPLCRSPIEERTVAEAEKS